VVEQKADYGLAFSLYRCPESVVVYVMLSAGVGAMVKQKANY